MADLSDIRILAVEQFGAGPFGSLHLADLGAEVIKIEDPRSGGDVSRYVPPHRGEADSLYFQGFNRNKRSIALDLTTDAGREVFHELVAHSDAVYSNLRGDVPERLGLTYAALSRHNPRLVCCSLSGYGQSGPRRSDPAYDYVLQGLTGWMSLTGDPDGPPTKSGLSLVDYCGGIVAALSLVSGVHAARRDGRGGDCDVSLFDTAMSMLTYPAVWWLTGGTETERTPRSSHPSIVPFGVFPTADGWLTLACAKEHFWVRLAEALGRGDLARDPRFDSFDGRRENRDALTAELDVALSERPTAHWLEVLGAAGVPCGPVNSVAEALADPHTAARDMVVEVAHPEWGTVREAATAGRLWDRPHDHRRAPGLGEDTGYLLRELLDCSAERIARLASDGAFGENGLPAEG